MRLKLLTKVLVALLLVGYSNARPQKVAVHEFRQSEVAKDAAEGWHPVADPVQSTGSEDVTETIEDKIRSQVSSEQRDSRDVQYMDHALRTVATQLLNVTNSEEVIKTNGTSETIGKKDPSKVMPTKKVGTSKTSSSNDENSKANDKSTLTREVNSEVRTSENLGVDFSRPTNSKFGHFKTSHPGQAMALTEEELEKEIALTRDMASYKTQSTTSGGISTWILLNPPSTTSKTIQEKEKPENDIQSVAKPMASIEKVEATLKNKQKPTGLVEKVGQTQSVSEKIAQKQNKPGSNNFRKSSTPKPTQGNGKLNKTQQIVDNITQKNITSVTPGNSVENDNQTTQKPIVTTGKPISRTTINPKVAGITTTWRPSMIKIMKPNFSRPKPLMRITTLKPEVNNDENVSSPKIEKVTFRPVQMILTQRNETKEERPMFVTKIKASVLTEMQKTTNSSSVASTGISKLNNSKSNFSGSDLVEIPVKVKPVATKINNVLKVQLRKPMEEAPKIAIEPMKVNVPVPKIEKIDENTKKAPKIEEENENDQKILDNSHIDLKFDFNPELTEIETMTEVPTVSTTTKRFRQGSNKRKKNKVRRRKPSTTSTTALSTMDTNQDSTELNIYENFIQESKAEPESKLTNSTKTKKKQVQKPISTQIYNFLSREIMPSFGVMSLVGLGLGLASYFLYPFGGAITRRNYEVEPNYKYNLDEYGGNYGQNEEEVFSKVLQGMTNHDTKYGGIKDYQNNYYRYQHHDGEQQHVDSKNTKKKIDQAYPTSSDPIYENLENAYDFRYKNTEFKYPDVPVTLNYYERQKQAEIMVGNEETGNRRFVVGNIPTEHSSNEKTMVDQKSPSYTANENSQSQFEHEVAQNHNNFPKNPVSYGQAGAQTLKMEDGYEEIEITPTAVVVEHGPRALKIKRSVDGHKSVNVRVKRDSVIQMIPPNEAKVLEQEEDLSNEILDIIDFMIPGSEDAKKMKDEKGVNKIDENNKAKEKKRHDEKMETSQKEFIEIIQKSQDTESLEDVVVTTLKSNEGTVKVPSTTETTSSSSANEENVTTNKSEELPTEGITEPDVVDLEDTTVDDWLDNSTTEKVEVPVEENFNIFSFVRKLAEVKFRLGLTILKHASEGFARYLGHIQKRINGEE